MDEYFAPKMGIHAEPSGNVKSFIPLYNETINKDFIPWDFNTLDKYTHRINTLKTKVYNVRRQSRRPQATTRETQT